MIDKILNLLRRDELAGVIDSGLSSSCFGYNFGDKTLITLASRQGKKLLYVCSDYVSANRIFEQIATLNDKAVFLPAREDCLAYLRKSSKESVIARVGILCGLLSGDIEVVVTTIDALMVAMPQRELLKKNIFKINKGDNVDLSSVTKMLLAIGYTREEQIGAKGQFALRGDILDIWSPNYASGARIEVAYDEVETIKAIDTSTQKSLQVLSSMTILPNTDIFIDDETTLVEKLRSELKLVRGEGKPNYLAMVEEICTRIENGDRDSSLGILIPYLSGYGNISDYFDDGIAVFDDTKQIVNNAKVCLDEHIMRFKSLIISGETLVSCNKLLFDISSATASNMVKVGFHSISSNNNIFSPQKVVNATSRPTGGFSRDYESLLVELSSLIAQRYEVILCCGDSNNLAFMDDFLAKHNVVGVSTCDLRLPEGAIFDTLKLAIFGTNSINTKKKSKTIARSKEDVFTLPSIGDYVVHNVHGVGLCEGIEKLDVMGVVHEYIILSYAGGDKLYVPIENMDSLSKYLAGSSPHLNKIGGSDFTKLKAKVKSSVKQMAFNLLELYSKREKAVGYKYSSDDSYLHDFEESFPFDETPDQLTSVAEGLDDLKKGKVMDRLLCGDVGYGKTEVALRLAFKVIVEGKQVAMISPTTILARQHYFTAIKRMQSFGVVIRSLTRFDSAQAVSATLKDLAEGKVDLVCGTHRVLSKDVIFKDLGLLILDEEQRFGVADKDKIKNVRSNVNCLSLSATPIPRTLHMSMAHIRDISILDTPPTERIPVQTFVSEYTDSIVVSSAMREINRRGQVFIVYNRVEKINAFASHIAEILPNARIAVAHGQLPQGELENIIENFVAGESDVLVCSTIIENGIDIARANTMIVIDSDRLGLSQLYQLRGRVGRSDKLAYVYFTYDESKILTPDAMKRLEAITQFTEFGSGFKIAMRDLEIRGAGNVLGSEQHGHMQKVGYDMYCKLLGEVMDEIKTGVVTNSVSKEVKVITDVSAYVPDNYILDKEWRINLYSRISRLKSNDDRRELLSEMRDIYGAVPESAVNLVTVGLVKNLVAELGGYKATLKSKFASISFEKAKDISPEILDMVAKNRDSITIRAQADTTLEWSGVGATKELIKFLLANCKN